MIRAFRTGLVVVPLVALGCASEMPTSPTFPPASSVVGETAGGPATFQTQALFDSTLEGSAYQLTGVAGTLLSFSNNQNTYVIAYDSNTRFRRAVLQSWQPGDPYYEAAAAYNAGDPFGDSWLGVLQALEGGNVRIVLLPPSPISPGDPYHILSFQPIP